MLRTGEEGVDVAGASTRAEEPNSFVRPKQSPLVRFGKRIRAPVNAFFARQSLIPVEPIIDTRQMPMLAIEHGEWQSIRDEAAKLLADLDKVPPFGRISPDHRRIAPGPQWKSYFFEGYGFRSEANRARCPWTAAFLDRIPGLVVAFFSIMDGDTHVPRHRGLARSWLNCHLPLIVPTRPGRCEIDVAGHRHRWREGEWFVFDETFDHEVWNETGQPRLVLMLQVRRPMRLPGRAVARTIYEIIRRTAFVQDVRKGIGA